MSQGDGSKALGLGDPEQRREALTRRLLEAGVPQEEIDAVESVEMLAGFALEVALRPPGGVLALDDAAEAAGIDLAKAVQIWRALGFPDPSGALPRIDSGATEALRLMRDASQLLGEPTTIALARLLGSNTRRIAEAVVDAFRVNFEMPSISAGATYAEIVEQYTALSGELVPRLVDAMGAILRAHLVAVASGDWFEEGAGSPARRHLSVGFVDLVGYTQLSASLTGAELAAVVGRFDELVTDVVGGHGGRVVKLLGDGALFVFDRDEDAERASQELVSRFDAEPGIPQVRVGLSSGAVVSVHGDYYGDVVNQAARLADAAEPGAVNRNPAPPA